MQTSSGSYQPPRSQSSIGPDPVAMLIRSRAYQQQQSQKKKRILILIMFFFLAFGFGYGVYAYTNNAWPFDSSTPGPSTRPGTPEPSDPSDPSDPTDPTFEWSRGPWGPCSEQCGGGTREREVVCEDKVMGTVADDSECPSLKPHGREDCNIHECAVPRDCEYTPWPDDFPIGFLFACVSRFSKTETRDIIPAEGEGAPCPPEPLTRRIATIHCNCSCDLDKRKVDVSPYDAYKFYGCCWY